MTVFTLRFIALITMTIDHLGAHIFHNNIYMRAIGRFAFPIYCFLLVEGFLHNKDSVKIKTHLAFLFFSAFVSEFPYDYMRYGLNFTEYLNSQNVMFTLLFGYISIIFISKIKTWFNRVTYGILIALGFSCLGLLLRTDYDFWGIFFINGLYLFSVFNNKFQWKKKAEKIYFSIFYIGFIILKFIIDGTILKIYRLPYIGYFISYILILILFLFYNGKLGIHNKLTKVISKTYYPLHQLLTGFISYLL